jgi:hypothetical protein
MDCGYGSPRHHKQLGEPHQSAKVRVFQLISLKGLAELFILYMVTHNAYQGYVVPPNDKPRRKRTRPAVNKLMPV